MLVLDSGAVTRLAEPSEDSSAMMRSFHRRGYWPPVLPSPVLIESLRGSAAKDARTNRFLKTCDLVVFISEALVRRAAALRAAARRGSAVDALVVATAEPGGVVLTTDPGDLGALAAYADRVMVASL